MAYKPRSKANPPTTDESLERRDRIVVPFFITFALLPVAAGYATIAAFDPGSAWYGTLANLFATWAPFFTILGVAVLGWSLFVAAVSFDHGQGRRRTLRWLTIAFGATLSLGYQLTPGRYVESRRAGIEQVKREGRSVFTAIEEFRAQYGRTPDRLEELVPEFLPTIPSPHLAGYPNFVYIREWNSYALYVPIQSWPDQVGALSYRSMPAAALKPESWRYGKWRLETDPNPFDPRPLPKR